MSWKLIKKDNVDGTGDDSLLQVSPLRGLGGPRRDLQLRPTPPAPARRGTENSPGPGLPEQVGCCFVAGVSSIVGTARLGFFLLSVSRSIGVSTK